MDAEQPPRDTIAYWAREISGQSHLIRLQAAEDKSQNEQLDVLNRKIQELEENAAVIGELRARVDELEKMRDKLRELWPALKNGAGK